MGGGLCVGKQQRNFGVILVFLGRYLSNAEVSEHDQSNEERNDSFDLPNILECISPLTIEDEAPKHI